MTAITSIYPCWQELFLHNHAVDSLNDNAGAIVTAITTSPTDTALKRFEDAALFDNCCGLARSAFEGHVWFIHHLQRLGNPILNPTAVRYVALHGLSDQSDLTLINPSATFHGLRIQVPKFELLLEMSSETDLDLPLPPVDEDCEECLLTGIVFLPPFLLDDLAALRKTDTVSIFLASLMSIRSWASDQGNSAAPLADLILKMEQVKAVIQWLWASHNKLIPATPIQPSMGLAELDWKSKTHRLNIQTSTVLPSSPSTNTPPIGASATPFSPSAELSVNLAKIATHFEQQSLDSSRKDPLQNPSWARLSTQAQGTILRAMTTNSEDASTDPTPEFQEFLSQRSASTAFIYLLEYFEANERSRYVSINQGLTNFQANPLIFLFIVI